MIRGIATADWHLGRLKRLFPADHLHRQMFEIEKIYQYAVSKGIKHVFVLGDITDTPDMDNDIYYELLVLLKKYDGLIHTHYIGGNHDRSDRNKTSLDLLHLLVKQEHFATFKLYLEPDQVKIDNEIVNFLPYPCKESLPNKKPCLNLSHIEYNGAIADNGRKLRVKQEFIQDARDYNLSGHIHQHQRMKSKRATFVGAPYQTKFGEKFPKGFVEFQAKTKKDEMVVKMRFVDNKPEFRLKDVTIKCSDDFGQLDNDRNIAYKLFVASDIVIPSDLRIQYPNIFNIFDLSVKSKKLDVKQKVVPTVTVIKPTSGLKDRLKDKGYSKKEIKLAHKLVDDACSELGFAASM